MKIVEQYLLQIVSFFTTNWIAAAVLALFVIFMAIKKPKVLFQIVLLIVAAVAVLYILIFLEQSMFSGVISKESGIEQVEKGIK